MKLMRKQRILSFFLAILMLITAMPISNISANAITNSYVSVLHNGKKTDSIVVAENEEIILESELDGIRADTYNWQIKVDETRDIWVDIEGYTENTCKVSYALVGSVLNEADTAFLRLSVSSSDSVYTSDPVAVKISYVVITPYTAEQSNEVPKEIASSSIITKSRMKTANNGIALAADGGISVNKYDIIVNFIYKDSGESVTSPFAASIAENENFPYKVSVPEKAGYAPFYDKDGDGVLEDDEELKPENESSNIYFDIYLENIQQNHTFNIIYKAVLVDFTVEHYFQHTDDEGYDLKYTTSGKQFTGYEAPEDLALTGDLVEGYTSQRYERLVIAADSSTIIKIYYHINYYLVDYDLSGGHGVVPVYARYGTVVGVKRPTRAGYTFAGWKLVEYNGAEPTAEQESMYNLNTGSSITVPAASLKFLALWSVTDTSFTVVYWRESESVAGDTSEIKYEYWGSEIKGGYYDTDNNLILDGSVKSNDTIYPADFKDVPTSISTVTHTSSTGETETFDEAIYFEYDADKTEKDDNGNQKVHNLQGDGTTVVEVYYNRKSYTLKFYYAASNTAQTQFYVVGGSTYYFGKNAITSSRNDEKELFAQYLNTNNTYRNARNERGEVNELPKLNELGNSRGYTVGYDTQRVNNTDYRLHYISFDAKYNANISEMWPTAVFDSVETDGNSAASNWDGTAAFVSAWNGEYNVYYTQHNNNQTIKGKYNKLGYQILWDREVTGGKVAGDDNTVTYLCFWENGADIGWSVPELYNYNIYLECLHQDGENHTGNEVYNENTGKYYYLSDSYPTVDDSDVKNQTVPPIQGYTFVDKTGTQITDYNKNLYKEAYDVNFFYDRTRYTLEFNNEGKRLELEGTPDGVYTIRYGVSLLAANMTPPYPDGWDEETKNAYRFDGWYTSPEFASTTKFVFDENTTMPANDLILFANWVPVEHTVELYAEYDDIARGTLFYEPAVKVLHGNYAPSPNTPTNGNYDFVGWFYQDYDENGELKEYAFVFERIPIVKDMKIYAKWSSNIAVPYTIYYKLTNGTDVAPPTEGSALAGSTQTFDAKTGTQLYSDYRIGFFPKESGNHTIQIDINGNNEYIFYYEEVEAVPYTVRYLEAGTDKVLKSEKTIENNRYTVVTEIFEHISGYMPDAYQKRLIVAADNAEHNVITFYYTTNTTDAYYRIVHYVEGYAVGTYTEYRAFENIGKIGSTVNENVLNIKGFEFKADKTKINGVVDSSAVKDNGNENMTVSGVVTAEEGLLIEIYYDRVIYDYTVNYLEQGTNAVLEEPKKATARYGTTVYENALNIAGYELITSSPQSRAIVEDNLVIDFHYQEKTVTITYVPLIGGSVNIQSEPTTMKTGELKGSIATAESGYSFVGWYKDAACTVAVDSTWVDETKLVPQKVGGFYQEATYYALFEKATADLRIFTTYPQNNNYEKIDPDQTFIFLVEGVAGTVTEDISLTVTLHGIDEITVTDLPVGTYKVTQMTDWSWRYEPMRQNYRDITISADKDTSMDTITGGNWVRFTETRTDKYWLDGNSYNVNIYKGE